MWVLWTSPIASRAIATDILDDRYNKRCTIVTRPAEGQGLARHVQQWPTPFATESFTTPINSNRMATRCAGLLR